MDKDFERCVPCKACPICYKKLKSGDPIIKRVGKYALVLSIGLIVSIIYTSL